MMCGLCRGHTKLAHTVNNREMYYYMQQANFSYMLQFVHSANIHVPRMRRLGVVFTSTTLRLGHTIVCHTTLVLS